jgi:hypothetical protein
VRQAIPDLSLVRLRGPSALASCAPRPSIWKNRLRPRSALSVTTGLSVLVYWAYSIVANLSK